MLVMHHHIWKFEVLAFYGIAWVVRVVVNRRVYGSTEWENLHFSKYFQFPQLSWVFMSLQHKNLAKSGKKSLRILRNLLSFNT